MRLLGKVEATRAEREVWCVSPLIRFRISGVNLMGGIRARNAVSETQRPLSRSRRACPRYAWNTCIFLKKTQCRPCDDVPREAELADVQACEVDAHATANALLQATCAPEDRVTQAERIAALPEREVRFLKALNIRLPLDYSVSLSSLRS